MRSLLFCITFFTFLGISLSDFGNVQDTCPASTAAKQALFINGFPCKDPANISASDFKSIKLNHPGNTRNFERSAMSILTAAEFPGLNTLGLAVARTDLEVDGIVTPHSHPRASEILFVYTGTVVAGFIDTNNKLFLKLLHPGDAFVCPKGLLHFCLNTGYELATVFSVLNSQNPGVVSIRGAISDLNQLKGEGFQHFENATWAGFTNFQMKS